MCLINLKIKKTNYKCIHNHTIKILYEIECKNKKLSSISCGCGYVLNDISDSLLDIHYLITKLNRLHI